MADAAEQHQVVLTMLPAGRGERQLALALVALSLLTFAVTAPFARMPVPRLPAFIPVYESALVVVDLITAALLYGQAATARSRALVVLAAAYLFAALITVAHALTFPGLFAPGGLLGAGPQTTAWLYMFWHAGFPLAIVGYALLPRAGAERGRGSLWPAIAISVAVVCAVVAGLTALVTVGAASLPSIMQGDRYTPVMMPVVAAVWGLTFVGLSVLWNRRPHAVLDVWLMVVLGVWLCDVALSWLLNTGRFDLGFYVGRLYGLMGASFVLLVLLTETGALYGRLAGSLEAASRARERAFAEVQSQLIHVSRLSELGQMVSALAHEVKQPLGAISNYLSAGRHLIDVGNAERAKAALEKAAEETVRAGQILQRLREFVRKGGEERRPEDVEPLIKETVALGVLGSDRHGVPIEVRLAPEARRVFIDKIQIQQVLFNLIRNALEAMANLPRRSLVLAAAPAQGDMIELSVADSGPGLAPAVRAKLFQPFVTTKSSGMGVGLSISRAIVEAHGGRMWAEGNSGGGTVFRFTVPRNPPDQRGGVEAAGDAR